MLSNPRLRRKGFLVAFRSRVRKITSASDMRTSLMFMLAPLIVLVPSVCVLLIPGELHAAANTITVNTTADPGSPGVCALRDAITAANTKTAVNGCAAGTGNDVITFSVSGTITLGSTLPAIANTSPNTLTIDGRGQTVTVDGASAYQVLVVNAGSTLSLNDLTIADGYTAAYPGGGAILVNGVEYGGSLNGALTITNCTFSANSTNTPPNGSGLTQYDGGAILDGGALTITNSTFSGNSANNAYGGAIFASTTGTLTITKSIFSGNSSGGGGALTTTPAVSLTTINDSTFSGNTAPSPYSLGGAINSQGPLTISGSTFSGNYSYTSAGAIWSTGMLTVTNSTFYGNRAPNYYGGAINQENPYQNLTIISSTFSGNSAYFGGAITSDPYTTTFYNSILANNSAVQGRNCIFGNNAAPAGSGNIEDDSSCDFGMSTAANGFTIGDDVSDYYIALDPGGLANNGGPTETIALESGSYAIGAIPQGSPNCPGVDQRGFGRPAPGYTACDVGAYEFAAVPPIDCNVTYNGTFNGNLTVSTGLTCIINGTVTGNVTESGGGLYTSNATIGGNLQIAGGGTFSITSTAVDGNVQIQNIPAGSAQNQICGTNVKGNLQIHNNGTAIAIGDPSMSCAGDTIGNDLQVNNNTAALQVFDDSAGGNLQCQNNTSIAGGGDTAKSLQGQCAGF